MSKLIRKSAIKYLLLVLIASIGLSAASCTPRLNPDGTPTDDDTKPTLTRDPITLEYWRLFDDSDVLDRFITEYQRQHPNINIEVKKIDLKPGETIYDYQDNLIKLIADGAGPDLFMMHNSWLPYMINQITPLPTGLLNIRDYKEAFPEVVQNDFIDNNRVYGIPFSIDNLMLYYNTDIFAAERIKQPPKTLQELVDLTPKLTRKDGLGRITRSAVALGTDTRSIPRAADILATLMAQYGTELTSPDKKTATFNLPTPSTNPPYFGGREALVYYTQFASPASPNTYTYSDATDSQGNRLLPIDIQAFIEGKSAMFIGNSYHVKNIRRFAPSSFHFDTAPMPQLRLQEPIVLANYFGETVSKTSKHPNEAWDFLRFMTSRQNQSAIAREIEAVSAHSGLLESSGSRRYYGAIAQQIPYSISWYRKNTPQIEEIFSRMINNVVKSGISPQIAIDTAVRDINALD